ncbi:MAG: helix-turn-helix domain-containing protein [Prevotella sp.]|nr:helix-turn-helix domain-containing protein [Staphylococcus sp.]MCM1350066.1 helix-turn-helix domain-containing protein [Prevotella sp.]
MEFKEKVLKVRVELNLSQTELAQKLNVSVASISRWEMGKTEPTRKGMAIFEAFCNKNNITFEEVGK